MRQCCKSLIHSSVIRSTKTQERKPVGIGSASRYKLEMRSQIVCLCGVVGVCVKPVMFLVSYLQYFKLVSVDFTPGLLQSGHWAHVHAS